MIFAVVVRVPDRPDAGNMAVDPNIVVETRQPAETNGWHGVYRTAFDVFGIQAIAFRTPVFVLGEVLVLDYAGGRELAGRGRKPSKWAVEVETFDTIKLAVERAQEVTR